MIKAGRQLLMQRHSKREVELEWEAYIVGGWRSLSEVTFKASSAALDPRQGNPCSGANTRQFANSCVNADIQRLMRPSADLCQVSKAPKLIGPLSLVRGWGLGSRLSPGGGSGGGGSI